MPHDVPVEKPIKAAKMNVKAGTMNGDSDSFKSISETNSAVCMSLVTNAIDHAIVRIKTALNISLKPSIISSMILPNSSEPRSKVIIIAESNEMSDDQSNARYELALPMVADSFEKVSRLASCQTYAS